MSMVGPALGIAGLVSAAAAVTCTLFAIDSGALEADSHHRGATRSEASSIVASASASVPSTALTPLTPDGDVRRPTHAPTCAPLEVVFGPASTALESNAQAALQPLARWLEEHASAEVLIEGHADARGSDDTNMWMSRERARVVAGALMKDGVARKRMLLRGFGAYQPVSDADEMDARQRRVVVSVRNSAECPPKVVVTGENTL